jgi:N-acetylglutamate synthase-like GNAT family acetyltransferase
VRHARDEDLDRIEQLLEEIRKLPGLTERKRGTFYRRSDAFLHFHEDPAGMFGDLKVNGTFVRYRVSTGNEQKKFVTTAKRALADKH